MGVRVGKGLGTSLIFGSQAFYVCSQESSRGGGGGGNLPLRGVLLVLCRDGPRPPSLLARD